MGNIGCCSAPQTDDDPPMGQGRDYIDSLFDQIEENVIVDIEIPLLAHVLSRCDRLKNEVNEIQKQRQIQDKNSFLNELPESSRRHIKDAESLYSPGSVWIGKICCQGREIYLELIVGRELGTGDRIVDFARDKTSHGRFMITAELISNPIHPEQNYHIVFTWEDVGEDFALRLVSTNFRLDERSLTGMAYINSNLKGSFELLRAISTDKQLLRSNTTSNLNFEAIESYSSLAFKKSSTDMRTISRISIMNDDDLDGYAYE